MTSDNIAQLIYLGVLATVLGGAFFLSRRLRLGQTLQMAAIWAAFTGDDVSGGIQLFDQRAVAGSNRCAHRGQAFCAKTSGLIMWIGAPSAKAFTCSKMSVN